MKRLGIVVPLLVAACAAPATQTALVQRPSAPVPALVASQDSQPVSESGSAQPAPSPAAPAVAVSTAAPVAAAPVVAAPPTPETALLVINHEFGESIDFTMTSNGKPLPGPFHVDEGKVTTFKLPAGKLQWEADWGPGACQSGDDAEEGKPNVRDLTMKAGDTVKIHCWQSNHMGMCCDFGEK